MRKKRKNNFHKDMSTAAVILFSVLLLAMLIVVFEQLTPEPDLYIITPENININNTITDILAEQKNLTYQLLKPHSYKARELMQQHNLNYLPAYIFTKEIPTIALAVETSHNHYILKKELIPHKQLLFNIHLQQNPTQDNKTTTFVYLDLANTYAAQYYTHHQLLTPYAIKLTQDNQINNLALCLDAQDQFWTFLSFYFNDISTEQILQQLPIDQAELESCQEQKWFSALINNNSKEAFSLGFKITPSYVFDDRAIHGALNQRELQKII